MLILTCASVLSLELPAGSVSRAFRKSRGFRTLVAPSVAALQVACRETGYYLVTYQEVDAFSAMPSPATRARDYQI
jgi:hypothetical protein